jgi:hypothetical protein
MLGESESGSGGSRMHMTLARRQLVTALLITVALLSTACPSSNDLDRMAKASNEIAHDTLTANRVVAEFYTAGKMSLVAKDKAADLIGRIQVKGEAFNNTLIELDRKYPQGTLPPDTLQLLRANFAELSTLVRELAQGLIPLGAQAATKDLTKHVNTIEGVLNK